MILLTATTCQEAPETFINAAMAAKIDVDAWHNDPNLGLVPAYHELWKRHQNRNLQIYMHDDVTIHDENWLEQVLIQVMDPAVAIVGLGGARGIGVADIYKTPYSIQQLVRMDYCSNQTDAETHGERRVEGTEVAVVDGFFMAVKGEFLEEVGGWSWIKSNFHCYDTALCLEAIRRGWEVRMVGVSCTHHGGGTSTTPAYDQWCRDRGTTMEEEHRKPHRWLYEEYRDILPVRR